MKLKQRGITLSLSPLNFKTSLVCNLSAIFSCYLSLRLVSFKVRLCFMYRNCFLHSLKWTYCNIILKPTKVFIIVFLRLINLLFNLLKIASNEQGHFLHSICSGRFMSAVKKSSIICLYLKLLFFFKKSTVLD